MKCYINFVSGSKEKELLVEEVARIEDSDTSYMFYDDNGHAVAAVPQDIVSSIKLS